MAALGRPCRECCLSQAQVSEARSIAPSLGGVSGVGGVGGGGARRRKIIDSLNAATDVEDLDADLEGELTN